MDVPVRIRVVGLSARERNIYRLLRRQVGLTRTDANSAMVGYLVGQGQAKAAYALKSSEIHDLISKVITKPDFDHFRVLTTISAMVNDIDGTVLGETASQVLIEPSEL